MPLINTYADAYLAPLVTVEREARAIADVADLGTLPAIWVQRLVILRAYVITCLESQKSPDDLFAAKLAAYRREFEDALKQARIAQSAAAGGTSSSGGSFFTVDLERA
jgi:hypothetical protein